MPGVPTKVSSTKTSHVPAGLHFASKMVAATAGLWKALGNLETRTLPGDARNLTIDRPVFVSGLARSGSTILTEVLCQHPQTTSLRYSDFPLSWTPYWWNSLRIRLPLPTQEPQERAHKDRMMITADSPEAIEEVLWMHFFPGAHKTGRTHVLDANESHAVFEKYYKNHIRKLLVARDRQRYVAKNNYNVTRLEYLLKLFPDARFIIPIREPVQHVASLVKQHRLFSQQNAEDPRISKQLKLAGHYEFGPERCPVIVDESRQANYDEKPDDVSWYAMQWADIYGFLAERMTKNQALRDACLVVHYEAVCARTRKNLSRVFAHAGLNDDRAQSIIESYAPTISAPDYYQPDFGATEVERIHQITGDTAEHFAPGDT